MSVDYHSICMATKSAFQKWLIWLNNFINMPLFIHKCKNSSCNQEYVHQDKKDKVSSDSKQNVGNINFFNTMISMVLTLVFKQTINYHQYLNQQTEFNNWIKNSIKMKHNLAKMDFLKILHDLKSSISAYDTIVG